jgi:lysophospholipase L1-like esterase
MGSGPSKPDDFQDVSVLSGEILWIGRTFKDTAKQKVRFDWSGTGCKFGVSGSPKEVWIKLDGQSAGFNVHIDGQYQFSFASKSGEREYCIAKDLNRDATIHLVKRTEAKNGMMSSTPAKLRSIGLPPGCQVTRPNPALVNSKKIEFIGDSDSAAFGNLAKKTGLDPAGIGAALSQGAEAQDVEKGFVGLVSHAFQADGEFICISGTGSTWDDDGKKEEGLMNYYARPLYTSEDTTRQLDPVDLVVIYLGGNDVGGGGLKKSPAKKGEVVQGYTQLLKMVKQYRPSTPILCLIPSPTMASAEETPQEQQQVSQLLQEIIPQAVESAGGASQGITSAVVPATINLSDDSEWGTLLHWSVKAHKKVAAGIIPLVSQKMGWQAAPGWDDVPADKMVQM